MSDMVIGDDGWTEIVGEQTRGGTPVANSFTPSWAPSARTVRTSCSAS